MNNPLERVQKKPRYEMIYEEIREKINNEVYKVGDRIPTEQELIKYYKVSRITTKKALDQLVNDGMIKRIAGKGSFVIDKGVKNNKDSLYKNNYLIGFVFPEIDDSYGIELFRALNQAADQHTSNLVVKQTYFDSDLEKNAITSLLDLGVDGIIILPVSGEYFNEEVLKLNINKFPHILVDRYFKGIQTTSVCTNNINSAKQAVHYLFDLNHEQIAIFSPHYKDISAIEDRIDGFIQAYAERGVMVKKDIWLTNIGTKRDGDSREDLIKRDIQLIKDHLLTHKEITAIFAVHYNIAILARMAALELNLSVPGDLSIICFDGPENLHDRFEFTHIKQGEREMGEAAMEAIISLIEKRNYPEKTFINTTLIEGKSTKKRK